MNQSAIKQRRLAEIEIMLNKTTDRLGRPIDEKIRPIVLYLQAHGITTSQSCQGHLDHGRPWPWVRIEAPGEPELRFANELQIYEATSREFAILTSDLQAGKGDAETRRELWRRLTNEEETPEFKTWARQNRLLKNKLADLLRRFYETHQAANEVKLEISKIGPASFELESAELSRSAFYRSELSQKSLESIKQLLLPRQAEMRAFGKYLKSHYWLEETLVSE